MDLDKAREFIRDNHRAVLATRRRSGEIQQSPVLVTVDGEGRLVISSRDAAYKTRNLRRDPWAQVCVFPNKFFGDWVVVQGDVEVVEFPDSVEPLVDYYRRIVGEHSDWEEYRESMRRERRVLLRLHPRTAGPDRHR
jgi:PPOX class probable F420-dependent enzyme